MNDVSAKPSVKPDMVETAPITAAQVALSVELMVVDTRNSMHVHQVKGASPKPAIEASGDVERKALKVPEAVRAVSMQLGDIKDIALAMASATEAKDQKS